MPNPENHIAELMLRLQGADISPFDERFLQRTLQNRMEKTACLRHAEYFQLLETHVNERENLLSDLQISHSTFFRHPLCFFVLEHIALPGMLLKKKRQNSSIRIWSAACAAGQETYSLAILLEELSAGTEKFQYRIFGTDYSERQLKLAAKGSYSASALENVRLGQLKKWFTAQKEGYSVIPDLKQNITFSVFDLFSTRHSSPPESIFGDFDIIMCANVLFYYKPEFRRQILEKIRSSLAGGGLLITGEAERKILIQAGFSEIYPHSAIFSEAK